MEKYLNQTSIEVAEFPHCISGLSGINNKSNWTTLFYMSQYQFLLAIHRFSVCCWVHCDHKVSVTPWSLKLMKLIGIDNSVAWVHERIFANKEIETTTGGSTFKISWNPQKSASCLLNLGIFAMWIWQDHTIPEIYSLKQILISMFLCLEEVSYTTNKYQVIVKTILNFGSWRIVF